MCFTLFKPPVALIAKKDIKVYKVIKTNNKSFWCNFQYERDKVYKLDKRLMLEPSDTYSGAWYVHEGFHSYKDCDRTDLLIYEDAESNISVKIVEFFIPKGTMYFQNEYEIVSENIRSGSLDEVKI